MRQDQLSLAFYEQAWKLRGEKIQEWKAAGHRHPLSLVEAMARFEQDHELHYEKEANSARFSKRRPPEDIDCFPTGKPKYRYVPYGEEVIRAPFYKDVVGFLLDYLEGRSFDAILELGSGYAQNLISLYYRGGPRGIPYFAGEYTKSGVDLANSLSQLDGDLPLESFSFDYKSPDLSTLGSIENLFIFSSHSIEQVAEVSLKLFEVLAAAAKKVECIHFEPFGFQIKLGNQDHGQVSKASARYFQKKDWNQNLGPVLLEAHKKEVLELTYMDKNVMGYQITQPTSIAIWKSRGES